MCTVSVVAAPDRLRVMVNRDERHMRPEAHPPTVMRTGAGLALLPLDPQGGGTWIAATSAGLVFAVLNVSSTAATDGPSRGHIILELLDAASLGEAVDRAERLCWRGWPPHRLIVMDGRQAFELRLRRQGLTMQAFSHARPLLFTSSSLGDDLVEPVRRQLFGEVVLAADERFMGQETFHRHRWSDRPHLSVHMRRHDAATHSITTVDVTAAQMAMRYEPVRELVGQPGWLTIPRGPIAAAQAPATPAALALVS